MKLQPTAYEIDNSQANDDTKAALIVNMPESCDMCDFVDNTQPPRHGERTLYCTIPGCGEDVTDYIKCRPECCPLQELPKHKRPVELEREDSKMLMNMGYNTCLDEILRGIKE